MSRVLTKDLQKKWLSGIIPPISVIAFIPLIASIWPEFKKQADNFADILDNPIYQAILGQLGLADITTWTGFFYMYIFLTLEIVVIFLSVLLPVRIISKEVDKKTLDLVLSYPIPRWRFLLEKFSVYLIYNLAYPILVLFFTFASTRIVGEEINYTLLTYSSIGIWMQLFALGALSLLIASIFLDSKKAFGVAIFIILGQYLFARMGGIVDSLSFIEKLSLLNYLNAANIVNLGKLPIWEFFVLLGVGVSALIGALIVFEKRELAIT